MPIFQPDGNNMAVEDDVRATMNHVINLVGTTGRVEGKLDAMDGRMDAFERTLAEHVRPCPDVVALKTKVEAMGVAPTGDALKNEQGIVKLMITKVVGPLVAAVGGVLTYIFATK